MTSMEVYPERRLLLIEDPRMSEYPATVLSNLLGQAREVVCKLFSGNIDDLGKTDIIKEFTACMNRVAKIRDSYSVAKYYETMFLFQQWFHSSYRARQGKVLESLMRHFLSKHTNLHRLSATAREVSKSKSSESRSEAAELMSVRDMLRILYPQSQNLEKIRQDVDILAMTSQCASYTCALAIQIRSRDDTGGTTAKGSLVDFLKVLCGLGEPSMRTLYLICVWDAGDENQKEATIGKILQAMKPHVKEERLEDMRRLLRAGKRFRVARRLYLQMRYGADGIQSAIEDWVRSAASGKIQNLADEIARWDDFWLAYAVASIEIHNKELTGNTNIEKLTNLLNSGDYSKDDLPERIDQITHEIVLKWDTECHPFSKPRDITLYIRDLLYLYSIYAIHCKNSVFQNHLLSGSQSEE